MSGRLEHDEQVEVAHWLRLHSVLHCAIPNAAKRSPKLASYLKSEGLSAGAPDLILFTRPPGRPEAHGVALEMKRAQGGKVSDLQKLWHEKLEAEGWVVLIGHGAADAKKKLEALGYGGRR